MSECTKMRRRRKKEKEIFPSFFGPSTTVSTSVLRHRLFLWVLAFLWVLTLGLQLLLTSATMKLPTQPTIHTIHNTHSPFSTYCFIHPLMPPPHTSLPLLLKVAHNEAYSWAKFKTG